MNQLTGGKPQIVRHFNKAAILNLIRSRQPISRIELSRLADLNKSTVSSIVADLLDEKIVYESDVGSSTGGRRPVLLNLNDSDYGVGVIEFGSEYTYLAISDLDAGIQERDRLTMELVEPASFINHCVAKLKRLRDLSGLQIRSIGISVPGIVHAETGRVIFSPVLQWRDVEVRDIICKAMEPDDQVHVVVENDANACVLAERWFGNLPDTAEMVFLSENMGAGIIANGRLLHGAGETAGQFGHITITTDGEPCRCGDRGCWTQYASSEATVKRYFSKHAREFDGNIEEEFQRVLKAATVGDITAIDCFYETGNYLGLGISNIVKTIDPEIVVVGGLITGAWDYIYPRIRRQLQQHIFYGIKNHVQIVPCSLLERPALVGAIALVVRHIFKRYQIYA